jgi:hypothetical protein
VAINRGGCLGKRIAYPCPQWLMMQGPAMRTHSPATLGGIVTVFALVVGCSSTTAGFGSAQSTPPVTSAATVLEQTTVTQTQKLTQTTTVQTTTAQPSTPVPPRTSPVSASSFGTSDAEIRS